jgi:glycosyltransferase involved in cell wall biosynthesis
LHQRRRHVDLVHLTSTELASLVGACHATAVLLAFDVFSRHSRRERSLAVTRARRLRWAIEERRLARWERRWLPRFAGVAVVSDVDAAAIRELTPVVPDVIPNPVVDAFFAPPQVERSDRTVTLVANLGYRPNIDAVEWLGREIWPRVIDSVPDAELEVVGANPAPGVEGEIRRAGGRLSANVPDVRPYYWRAAVAVAPIRGGSGLRNKVLHAMACGAPIVATSTALEGIDAVSRRHLLVADDAAGFAAAIVETLHDREHAAQRTVAARELLDAHRSDAVGERFEAWWARSMTSPRVRPERG